MDIGGLDDHVMHEEAAYGYRPEPELAACHRGASGRALTAQGRQARDRIAGWPGHARYRYPSM